MATLDIRDKTVTNVAQTIGRSIRVAKSARHVEVERAIVALSVTVTGTLMVLFAIAAKMDSSVRRVSRYLTWSALCQMTPSMSAALSFGLLR
jgi:hypothetical protein